MRTRAQARAKLLSLFLCKGMINACAFVCCRISSVNEGLLMMLLPAAAVVAHRGWVRDGSRTSVLCLCVWCSVDYYDRYAYVCALQMHWLREAETSRMVFNDPPRPPLTDAP